MFTSFFIAALLSTTLARLWLAARQIRHVSSHREQVPPRFADRVTLAAHRKAADYTVARVRLGMVDAGLSATLLVAWTLLGALQLVDDALGRQLGDAYPLLRQLALIGSVVLVSAIVELPLAIHRQFRLEARFGFNRTTPRLFVVDMVKSALLGLVLGAPLAAAVLWLMNAAGTLWWLYAWFLWMAFNLLLLWLFPTVIAPLFNRFAPLGDASLKARIEALLARCGFAAKGVFVMDGSKRSAHGNAYFTGFGSAKRIVFFDTLIEKLTPDEIEAVLAHELGHFARRHVIKRIATTFAISLAGLAVLGWVATQGWFYVGLGTDPIIGSRDAFALVLFFLVVPVFLFPLAPATSFVSRKHEFEADAYAAEHARAEDLIRALVKLYEENASTLTPDPLHSAIYDSHPPAAVRIGRLEHLAGNRTSASLAPQPA